MTTESAIIDLTTQTTALLNVVSTIAVNTTAKIATAVAVSENASQIPLVNIATNMINTQALIIIHTTGVPV